jgi:hypothetical protein
MVVRSKDLDMDECEDLAMRQFGVLLWELISRQPPAKHGEGFHLVLFLESIMHFLFTQLIV